MVAGILCLTGLTAQQEVDISGDGFAAYKEVTLKKYSPEHLEYRALETKPLQKGGRFAFETKFLGDNLYELNFDEEKMVHLSVQQPTNITVSQIENTIRIEGSPYSVKMQEFVQQNGQLQAKHFGQLKVAMDKAMKEGNKEEVEKLQQQASVAVQDFLVEFRRLIIDMGTNSAGLYALQYTDFNKERLFAEERLAAFQKEAPGAAPTKALEKLVRQAQSTEIGQIPPDFTARDKAGNPISLGQLKGKLVLIDFWAYWCRPCRVEHPKIAALFEKYRNIGFHVLSITQEVDKSLWEKAITKDGIAGFQHVFDTENKINNLYSVSSLPQNLLLDRDGKIIAKNVNAEALGKILEDL